MAAKFTFSAEGPKVEARVIEFENRSTANESNAVCLDSTVTVQGGAFVESFKASLTTNDLVSLREQLKSALTSLNGAVAFENTGGALSLSIKLESDRKTSITGVVQPNRLRQGTLNVRVDSATSL